MKILRSTIWILILSGALPLSAQNTLSKAFDEYKAGRLEEARKLVEIAVIDPSLMSEPNSWYLKGFIYKDLYKQKTEADSTYRARQESVKAFEHLLGMKGADKYFGDAHINLRYLATTFYNDAVKRVDQLKFNSSKEAFDLFTHTLLLSTDTTISIRTREIDYYMTVASKSTAMHKSDTTGNTKYFETAVHAYEHVLEMDSANIKANYNLAVIFYNEAVNIISKLDYDAVDIFSFNAIEDQSIDFFKESLPYMHRAQQLDPSNKNTIEGLAGIYFGLRDFEKSNYYKEMLK
ncbi:MAG TPA: hypothetical protein VFW11_13045 [Cyclobacteriaceae bacterium]|nr:hypothetical protein [Cyclobacteriaceae bacterium]